MVRCFVLWSLGALNDGAAHPRLAQKNYEDARRGRCYGSMAMAPISTCRIRAQRPGASSEDKVLLKRRDSGPYQGSESGQVRPCEIRAAIGGLCCKLFCWERANLLTAAEAFDVSGRGGDHVNLVWFAQRSSYSFLEGASNQDWRRTHFRKNFVEAVFLRGTSCRLRRGSSITPTAACRRSSPR
jgi:hypothetical protein